MQQPIANSQIRWQDQLKIQKFSFAKFEIKLVAEQEINLPKYKGSALRGGFGNVFRNICCTTKKQDCTVCILKENCAYSYVFETPQSGLVNVAHTADNYPHPFVIEPPLDNCDTYSTGDILTFNLILFGKSISFLPYFIYSFDSLGRIGLGRGRGKYKLQQVSAFDNLFSDEKLQIYDSQSQTLNGNFKIWKFEDILNNDQEDFESFQINFLTPTRIVVKKKPIQKITFELFIRTLLRRISWLGKIHCDGEWQLPYHEIISSARENVSVADDLTKWTDWERYSTRQKQRMKLGGITGNVSFKGDIKPFFPLILLGEYAHLGKNTTFGLGKYKLS